MAKKAKKGKKKSAYHTMPNGKRMKGSSHGRKKKKGKKKY